MQLALAQFFPTRHGQKNRPGSSLTCRCGAGSLGGESALLTGPSAVRMLQVHTTLSSKDPNHRVTESHKHRV